MPYQNPAYGDRPSYSSKSIEYEPLPDSEFNHRDAGEYAESSRIAQRHDEAELATQQDKIMAENYNVESQAAESSQSAANAAANAALQERRANDELLAHLQGMA